MAAGLDEIKGWVSGVGEWHNGDLRPGHGVSDWVWVVGVGVEGGLKTF